MGWVAKLPRVLRSVAASRSTTIEAIMVATSRTNISHSCLRRAWAASLAASPVFNQLDARRPVACPVGFVAEGLNNRTLDLRQTYHIDRRSRSSGFTLPEEWASRGHVGRLAPTGRKSRIPTTSYSQTRI